MKDGDFGQSNNGGLGYERQGIWIDVQELDR